MPEDGAPGVHVEETDSGTGPAVGSGSRTGGRADPEKVDLEAPTLTVSLAVRLVEGTTGGAPVETPTITLAGIEAEAHPKSDRYLLFLDVDLPPSPATIGVEVAGGDRYRDVTREVVVVGPGDQPAPPGPEVYPASEPVVTVHLFGADDTVVRGVVRDGSGEREGGGELRVADRDLTVPVDANGRFVLHVADPPVDGELGAVLEVEGLDPPETVTLPVAGGEETAVTLVVSGGSVTVESDA